MTNRKHYAAGVAAFVIWGFFPLALRTLQEYPAGEILYFRILFSLLVLVVVIAGAKKTDLLTTWSNFQSLSRKEQKTAIFLTLGGSVLLTLNWLAFIYIVNTINIRTASFSYLICPVITAVLGYILIKERMTWLQWVAVGLCTVSCILMGINSALELGYSFFTAVAYALYLVSQRKNQGFDRMIILGVQTLFSFVFLSFFAGYLVDDVPAATRFYTMITLIAIVFTVLPLFLNLYALNRINSATIGILMYLNPIINFILAFLLFKETVNALQITGYIIIAVALVIFNYPILKKLHLF